MVEIDITVLSKQEYYDIRIEHGENINSFLIPNSNDAIYDVCNVCNTQKFPDRKQVNF